MNPNYTPFHPKWHRSGIPIFWWLRNLAYTKFISRELTSLAVAYVALLLLVQIWALAGGEEAYLRFTSWLRHPVVLVAHALVLLALLFHTVTWLNLAPKALVLRIGGRRVPDGAIIAAHYLAWFAASGGVAWMLLRL